MDSLVTFATATTVLTPAVEAMAATASATTRAVAEKRRCPSRGRKVSSRVRPALLQSITHGLWII